MVLLGLLASLCSLHLLEVVADLRGKESCVWDLVLEGFNGSGGFHDVDVVRGLDSADVAWLELFTVDFVPFAVLVYTITLGKIRRRCITRHIEGSGSSF